MNLAELQRDLADKQTLLSQRVGAKNALEERVRGLESEVETLTLDMATTEKAVYLLQKHSEDQQSLLASRVEGIVTAGIRAVFQNPTLVFKMHYSESKGGGVKKTPEVKLSVQYEAGSEVVSGSLRHSFGGGLAVVVATLLNVIVVLHMSPRLRPILILDEPLSDLSPNYSGADELTGHLRERMADFLKTLTAETDVQLVVVSHEEQLGEAADRHYHFKGGIGRQPLVEDRTV